MKIVFTFLTALTLLLVLPSAGLGHQSTGLHWKVRPPFTAYVVSSIDDAGLQALTVQSAADWSESPTVDFVVGPAPKRAAIVIRISDDAYGPVWSGLTVISNDQRGGGHITGVSILLNTSNLDQTNETFDQYVICQELGHALGLRHTDDQTSCMGPNAGAPHPSEADFAALEALY